ncbi:hypothetical protein INT43_003815 [Umbelopsis isabellina]|uniref:Major facilitator superfamily (MFS) profile domain-containing protein n=1 Tax=Mortierella isabellina TaxID=91625 RepID=A0A8H7PUD2_MORIS|nr:hypothetical protein INT43_003815 [Umbelopsis isabellina]
MPKLFKLSGSEVLAIFAGSFTLLIGFGFRQTFGLFLLPITKDYEWDRTTFSVAAALLQIFWGLTQPFVVFTAERHLGFGRVLFVTNIVYGLGMIIMALVPKTMPGLFIFAMGIIVGLGTSGSGFSLIFATLGRRFPQGSKRHALVIGLVSSCASLGQGTCLPIIRIIIEQLGWKWTLIIQGCICIAIAPLAIFLRTVSQVPAELTQEDPASKDNLSLEELDGGDTEYGDDIESRNTGEETLISNEPQTIHAALKEAFSHTGFWLINICFAISGFHLGFIFTHLPAYVKNQGFDSTHEGK